MSTVLLIVQLIISIILTGLILIQRSEGGALGIGGGGGGGGLMSGRSATTSIVRMTSILGVIFLINCLALAVVYQIENKERLIIDDEAVATQPATPPESTPDAEETLTEALTPDLDSSEGSDPLAEETPAEDAGPEKDK
jgi:preprotein translocase subunit SecG